jgi:hypothetical protein
MAYSYWLGVRPEGRVNVSGHLYHFWFCTTLLNPESGPLSVDWSLPIVILFLLSGHSI